MYSTRVALACLITAAASPARGLDITLDRVIERAQAQERKQLCWAATSVSVVNGAMPAPEFADAARRLTQQELVIDSKAVAMVGSQTAQQIEAWTSAQSRDIHARALSQSLDVRAQCQGMPSACVAERSPMIKDIQFDRTDDGEALRWCDVRRQVEKGRPILFGIQNADLELASTGGRPSVIRSPLHFLMVVGVRDTEGVNEVLVWDPWPASSPGTSRIAADHTQWIPYSVFKSPKNEFGVAASHQRDRYNFRRPNSEWRESIPKVRGASCARTPVSMPVRLKDITTDHLWSQFRPEVVNGSPGRVGLPDIRAGDTRDVAMPVLAISDRRLADARGDAASIMVDRVSSAIVADRTGSRITRVYLVLNDERSWRREGYVNLGIVRKLFEVRHRRGGEEFGALRQFYLVSIPSSRAFFLAAGPPGPNTPLIPIESDPELCTREGVEVSAGDVLPRLYQNMLREAGLPFERDVLRCRAG